MTSYIVYPLVAQQTTYLGLIRRGIMKDANVGAHIVYPQLVRKPLKDKSLEFRIVNDAFIFAVIKFLEGDYEKRLSMEATTSVR